MPESKRNAIARAKREGFPKSSVVNGGRGCGYFIAPHGIESSSGKKTYGSCRCNGGNKEKCAKIAWSVENG